MIKLILWIWQFPQQILGFCLSRNREYDVCRVVKGKTVHVYYVKSVKRGLSLGSYNILSYYRYCGKISATDKLMELEKYRKLSLILGWLYLPLVGIFLIKENL